jgi:Xaa-Pro aminopeptidase
MNKIALAKEGQVNEKYQGFEKTVKAIKKGGSARDPEAVAAAIGRKKYGKERFQKAAAAGRKLGESLRLTESEIQTAQVVLAAQDMVDRIQGMMEDISEMQFKDLPALVNSIKNDMGVDQATQFQTQASSALSNLLTAVQAGKTEMEGAQGVLTGQAPVVPGQDATTMAAAPAAGEEEVDLSLDANLPAGEEEEEEQVSVGLGRERR